MQRWRQFRDHTIGLVTSSASHHNRRGRLRATDSAPFDRWSMSSLRIALANLEFPSTPAESVTLAERAIAAAAAQGAGVICFPECFVPGYRTIDRRVPPADAEFLERAWSAIAVAAGKASLGVVLGTERVVDGRLLISALVINPDGTIAGFQDKVQLDPSEETTYSPGSGRRLFRIGALTFGVAICHEGWRYPETVRWAVRARRADRVPSTLSRSRGGRVPPVDLRRSSEHVPRKGGALPCRREHLLFRHRELCARRARRRRPPWCGRTDDYSRISRMALEGCSSRTSIWRKRRVCLRDGTSPRQSRHDSASSAPEQDHLHHHRCGDGGSTSGRKAARRPSAGSHAHTW